MYVGDAPDGRQFLHIFIGRESLSPMGLAGGAVANMAPILDVMDPARPAILVVNVVDSEAETAETCEYNMSTIGFPLSPPNVTISFYGKRPSPGSVRAVGPNGVVSREPPPPKATGPERSTQKSRSCEGCGSVGVELDDHNLCSSCREIIEGLTQAEPLNTKAEALIADIAAKLMALRELGVPVEVIRDPDMLNTKIALRCGETAFERLNI